MINICTSEGQQILRFTTRWGYRYTDAYYLTHTQKGRGGLLVLCCHLSVLMFNRYGKEITKALLIIEMTNKHTLKIHNPKKIS